MISLFFLKQNHLIILTAQIGCCLLYLVCNWIINFYILLRFKEHSEDSRDEITNYTINNKNHSFRFKKSHSKFIQGSSFIYIFISGNYFRQLENPTKQEKQLSDYSPEVNINASILVNMKHSFSKCPRPSLSYVGSCVLSKLSSTLRIIQLGWMNEKIRDVIKTVSTAALKGV